MEGEARPRIPHTPDLPATPSSVFWATAFPLRGVGYQGHLPGPMSEGFRPTPQLPTPEKIFPAVGQSNTPYSLDLTISVTRGAAENPA